MSLDSIFPNPDQPRTQFKKEEIEELATSIEKDGLLQPILVRQMGDGTYQIIAGERRWQASKASKKCRSASKRLMITSHWSWL